MSEDISMTVTQLRESLGEDAEEFIEVMSVVQDIIDNPNSYHSTKAVKYAAILAAYRYKVGIKAQHYKTSGNSSIINRRRKDVFQTMYHALEENINTLKLLGRIDAVSAGILR